MDPITLTLLGGAAAAGLWALLRKRKIKRAVGTLKLARAPITQKQKWITSRAQSVTKSKLFQSAAKQAILK